MFDGKTIRELVEIDMGTISSSIRWNYPIYFYWVPLPDGCSDIDLPSVTGLFLQTALERNRQGTVKILRELLNLSREKDWRKLPRWMIPEMITREDLLLGINLVVKEFKINELIWEVNDWPTSKRGYICAGLSDKFSPSPKQEVLFE